MTEKESRLRGDRGRLGLDDDANRLAAIPAARIPDITKPDFVAAIVAATVVVVVFLVELVAVCIVVATAASFEPPFTL